MDKHGLAFYMNEIGLKGVFGNSTPFMSIGTLNSIKGCLLLDNK